MFQGKSFLAIIPARGGSKRLPRKNILSVAGKPLITWTIEAGLNSSYIDKVVVTSDDDEILDTAKLLGCEIIKRPKELATDIATSFDAIKHAMDSLGKYDYIVLLQPTSPLRNKKHVDESIELMGKKKADAVISVAELEHSPLWSNTLPLDGSMNSFIREEMKNSRSQDLEKYYRLNGAIYISQWDRLMNEKTFLLKDNVFAYVMAISSSIDIDEKFDLEVAALTLEKQKSLA